MIKPLAKSVLIPLGLIAAAPAADAGIHKKILGSGRRHSSSAPHNAKILIISNSEMNGIIKMVKSFENSGIGTHWVALYVHNNNASYFDSFRVEHIPKEMKTFINNKNIKTNIFRIQSYDSVMCGYFWIGFIDFMLAGKKVIDYTNLFSPYDFKKNNDIIFTYFKNE